MKITVKTKKYQNKEWLYIKPYGELDMATADEFKKAITEGLIKSGSRMLWLDFAEMSFIDSSGLGVILGRYRELSPLGGKVIISHSNPQVYRLLVASGLHRIMQIDKPSEIRFARA